jgi:glycosyltransferase involved in cell wall biosynthesis
MNLEIPKLSATIITLNEENNLAACIKSLDWVDEIIVVDSLSTDNTREIARSLGAIVYEQKFLGHVQQKQLAVDYCTHDWVFCLDADERVSEELKESILNLFKNTNPQNLLAGYTVGRRSFHLGRWIMHGGWYPDRKIRLFQKNRGHWGGVNPHDKIIVEGKYGALPGDIDHYVFDNLAHNVRTNNSYSSISAEILFKQEQKPSLTKVLFKPLGKFIETYIVKRGFLDGFPGLIISIGAAYSMFLKYAKLWELNLQKNQLSQLDQSQSNVTQNKEEAFLSDS